MWAQQLLRFLLAFIAVLHINCTIEEEEHGVKYANLCEACKVLSNELEERLAETGKSHDVIHAGYAVDDVKPKKSIVYRKSELRLIESLENICDRVLQYNVHKERKDSTRFAKGMSQTFQTLHGLVDKGVKVDLGIPFELWDTPSAEVSKLKSQCESLVDQYENDIEEWYFGEQETNLQKHLCEGIILKGVDQSCLTEVFTETKGDEDGDPKTKDEL